MPGSKNINIFPIDLFTMDSKSQAKKLSICDDMSKLVDVKGDWDWTSDKTGFWLQERNNYFIHFCDKCSLQFNYPIRIMICPHCNVQVIDKYREISLGKIEAGTSKEWTSTMNKVPVANGHMLSAAQQDLKEHPIQEAGFDWQHLKDNV